MASLALASATLGLARPLERSKEPTCRASTASCPASLPACIPASPDTASRRVAAGIGLENHSDSCFSRPPRHRRCRSPRAPMLKHASSSLTAVVSSHPFPVRPRHPTLRLLAISSLGASPLSSSPEAELREGPSLHARNRTRLVPCDVGGPRGSVGKAISGTWGAVDDLPIPEAHVQGAGVSMQAPASSVKGESEGESIRTPSQQSGNGCRQEQLPQQGFEGILRLLERIQRSTLAILHSIDVLRPAHERLTWSVPWKGDTIFQVMFLWFMAFWFIGSWLIPVLSQLAGLNHAAMSLRAHALYSLSTDVAEMAVGMFVLHSCLSRFRPLSAEWFHLKPRGRWYLDAVLACALFPIVQLLSQLNSSLLPVSLKLAAPAMRIENSVSAQDPIATVIYAATVAVCAPVWEEVVFRGFLLPSLTRYLPLWGSIAASAAIFSLAHFSLQRLLPLFFLGVVLGVVFARSQNLLTSILSHSLWNCFVFLDLLM